MNKFKIFFLGLMMMFGALATNAQTYSYRAFSAAYKFTIDGRWSNWSNWQKVSTLITIDYDRDVIKVYADDPQVYVIYSYDGKYTDSSGGQQVQFSVVDQDGDNGKVRLRIETNGNSQLYVDFADLILCWNVRKI